MADTLVGAGRRLNLTQHTDSTAVVQAAEEKGVWCSGYDSDMLKYGPKTHTQRSRCTGTNTTSTG